MGCDETGLTLMSHWLAVMGQEQLSLVTDRLWCSLSCSWQYAGQEVLICTYWGKNPTVQVVFYPIYGHALRRLSYQSPIRKFTVSNSDTFKRLTNVPMQIHQLESGICDERNWPYQCGFQQFVYSLMSRVTASPAVLLLPLSIAMHIISLHWWISDRVCYMYRSIHR